VHSEFPPFLIVVRGVATIFIFNDLIIILALVWLSLDITSGWKVNSLQLAQHFFVLNRASFPSCRGFKVSPDAQPFKWK